MTTSGKTIRPVPRSTNGQKPKVDDDVLEVDINDLTIDEIEIIENIVDAPIDALQDPKIRKAPVLRAIGYVIKKRSNPEFTLEDAGKLRVMFTAVPVPPIGSGTS